VKYIKRGTTEFGDDVCKRRRWTLPTTPPPPQPGGGTPYACYAR